MRSYGNIPTHFHEFDVNGQAAFELRLESVTSAR